MKRNQVFFSICIPTFNSVDYLKRLLDSIFMQSFSDFEVIINDDSTSHDVMNFCEGIEDFRLNYFKHKSNYSATENWNDSLSKATGRYKILVHHDDFFFDEHVLKNIAAIHLEKGEKDAFFLGFINENKTNKFFYDQFSFQNILKYPEKLLFVNYLSAPSCLILNQTIAIGYDEKLTWLVDVELYRRLLTNYKNIEYVPQVKMVIGGGDERITNTISSKLILSEFLYLRKRKIYNYKLGLLVIKLRKIEIIIIEYVKHKLNGNSK